LDDDVVAGGGAVAVPVALLAGAANRSPWQAARTATLMIEAMNGQIARLDWTRGSALDI
jgi:hypothetical protein